jgi:hypothetical protein
LTIGFEVRFFEKIRLIPYSKWINIFAAGLLYFSLTYCLIFGKFNDANSVTKNSKNMRNIFKPLCTAFIAMVSLISCTKETNTATTQTEAISQETLAKIKALGFETASVQRHEDGYLVEEDIILSEASLNEAPTSPQLTIASEEQYRTNNLVKGLPRSISVSISGTVSSTFIAAVDGAIARYNAEKLLLTFKRVTSGGNINIRMVNTGQYIASAGFPTSEGQPYSEIKYSNRYANYGLNFMTTVIAHEMGHCIGFRHTDYMDRSFSCGGSTANEGASSVGAVHIPGTPTTADNASWMLACLSSTTNRPFNVNDKSALNYLY